MIQTPNNAPVANDLLAPAALFVFFLFFLFFYVSKLTYHRSKELLYWMEGTSPNEMCIVIWNIDDGTS